MTIDADNPLLNAWNTPFNLPPFHLIEDAHFAPAFDAGFTQGRAAIKAIVENDAPPSFENTIEALEQSEAILNRALGVFFGVSGPDSNDARDAIEAEYMPKLSEYATEITANTALFDRIKTLWEQRDTLDLSDEQARVLMLTHRSFVRAGAALDTKTKKRVGEINATLAGLSTQFSQNLLADEKSWFLPLDAADIEELPDFVVEAATTAGEQFEQDGPVVTLARPLSGPFLTFSSDRTKRQKLLHAIQARGANGGETDNREIAAQTLALRAERSTLLGYESYSDYKLETEMAKSATNVRGLLERVWAPAKLAAEADAEKLTERLHADGHTGPLEPWDWAYYSNLRKKDEHDLDEAEIKPYLQLEKMIEACFTCANRLFDLSFEALDEPMYLDEVRAWNVTRNGEHIAVFIGDYYARPSKRSGAWCMAMRAQQKLEGDIKPIVLNVCNFAKSSGDKPDLLSYNDARTLFHEFGHALHQMLSDVTYDSISGTSVARDFVELPSQLYEHWLEVPSVLEEFACHAETGEPMPADMLQRLLDAQTYDEGYMTTGYVASALIDLDAHDGPPPADIMQSQAETLDRIGMPHAARPFHLAPHFQHIFAGEGYASGYYSYMWSEVMDADAFEAFKESDPFDKETAKRLEENILSRGGSADPEALYTAFRGKMPTPDAMLKARGLLE